MSIMLVFIDESGDSGLKIEKGSSRYFTVSLVMFEDNDEALACDQRIKLLKKELGLPENYEFHFKRQLAKYLRRKTGSGIIKKVKMQRSEGNNLLQLADYAASVINRSVQNRKKWSGEYRKIIAHREIYVQIWPK